MTRKMFTRFFAVFAVLTVALVFTDVACAAPAPPGNDYPPSAYQDPAWAPNWFKNCDGPKSWADWAFVSSSPYHPDNEGWNWVFTRVSPYVSLSGYSTYASEYQGKTGVLSGSNGDGFSVWMDNEQMDFTKQVLFEFDIWTEQNDLTSGIVLYSLTSGYVLPISFTLSGSEGGVWRTATAYWEIPQPDWESVMFVFNGAEGNTFAIDSIRMATQCPEPGTLLMLTLAGLMGLVYGYRRRK